MKSWKVRLLALLAMGAMILAASGVATAQTRFFDPRFSGINGTDCTFSNSLGCGINNGTNFLNRNAVFVDQNGCAVDRNGNLLNNCIGNNFNGTNFLNNACDFGNDAASQALSVVSDCFGGFGVDDIVPDDGTLRDGRIVGDGTTIGDGISPIDTFGNGFGF